MPVLRCPSEAALSSLLGVFLYQIISLRVTQLAGFLQVLQSFLLLALDALGDAEEQVAVAMLRGDVNTLAGRGDGLVRHSHP